MELIDNLIYAVLNATSTTGPVVSDYLGGNLKDIIVGTGVNNLSTPITITDQSDGSRYFGYTLSARNNFLHLEDTSVVEKGIQKHWFDIGKTLPYAINNKNSGNVETYTPLAIPPYHIIYAYLIENTRIAQIFEKVISLALQDEVFGMPTNLELSGNVNAMQWLINTENLFYKDLPAGSYRNISSQLRVFPEATRRNAYYRMFGMDLAFGDSANQKIDYPYMKASSYNSGFVLLFEQFFSEIWQAYINAKNVSGANTTDYEHISELGTQLHNMLMSRRTSGKDLTNYKYFTLSKEEYASVIMMSWLMYALDSNSPIVQFLKCEANSSDEILLKIGLKVGLPAHSKTRSLMEMAAPLAALLRSIENGDYRNTNNISAIITSQSPNWTGENANPSRDQQNDRLDLTDLLKIISNWEIATDHRLKNREANIRGTVRIQSNGVKGQPTMN